MSCKSVTTSTFLDHERMYEIYPTKESFIQDISVVVKSESEEKLDSKIIKIFEKIEDKLQTVHRLKQYYGTGSPIYRYRTFSQVNVMRLMEFGGATGWLDKSSIEQILEVIHKSNLKAANDLAQNTFETFAEQILSGAVHSTKHYEKLIWQYYKSHPERTRISCSFPTPPSNQNEESKNCENDVQPSGRSDSFQNEL